MNALRHLLFNRYTRFFYSPPFIDRAFYQDNKRLRVLVFTIEGMNLFLMFSPIIFVMAVTIQVFMEAFGIKSPELISSLVWFFQGFIFFTLMNKDFVNGQSIVHRIWGFKVVDYKTGNTATEFQCLIRNMTTFLLVIEFLFIHFSPERRLGDFLAGTRLIRTPSSPPENILAELQQSKITGNSVVALAIPVIIFCAWRTWI